MPWELTIVNYDGTPPPKCADADKARELPLGTLEDVRQHISATLPGTEWFVQPPLIEIMKANGSQLWEEWDAEMLASASKPKLNATWKRGDLSFEMFGFEQPEALRYFLIDVRGQDNPLPWLKALCEPRGWSAAEMGKGGSFLDFSGSAQQRWDDWQAYLQQSIKLMRQTD